MTQTETTFPPVKHDAYFSLRLLVFGKAEYEFEYSFQV